MNTLQTQLKEKNKVSFVEVSYKVLFLSNQIETN